jgi:O-antigen/teichoic acid export membrane protein
MLKALLQVFSVRFAGSLAGFGISLLLLAFLDPVMLGLFFVVDSTALLIALLISFSVPSAVMPLRAAGSATPETLARINQTLFAVTLVQVLGVLVISILVVGWLTDWLFKGHWIYIIALAPLACVRLFLFDFQRAEGRLILAALLQDRKGRNILFCAFLVGLVVVDPLPEARLEVTLAALGVAAFLPVLVGLVALNWPRLLGGLSLGGLRAEMPSLGKMVMKLATYSVLVRSFPPTILSMTGALAGAPAAATLGLVYSLAGLAEMATGAARITLVKAVDHFTAGVFGPFNRAFVTSILFSISGTLLAIIVFWAVGFPLLARFYDLDALPAFETTVLLMLLVALVKATTTFQEVLLKNIGDLRSLTWSYSIATLLGFGLAAILLPQIGAVGAALAHLVVFTTVGVWNWIYVQRRYQAPQFSTSLLHSAARNIFSRLTKRF